MRRPKWVLCRECDTAVVDSLLKLGVGRATEREVPFEQVVLFGQLLRVRRDHIPQSGSHRTRCASRL